MANKKPIRITMTSDQFQECLRRVRCLTLTDFKLIFGEEHGNHLHRKLKGEHEDNVANFIFGLDLSNMESLFNEFQMHLLVRNIAPSITSRGGHIHNWVTEGNHGGLYDVCDVCGEMRA
jgi:hypothetical protein